MVLVDVNLLVYAVFKDSANHDAARQWLDAVLGGTEPVALPWAVLAGFVRISTNPRTMSVPLKLEKAIDYVDEWLALPSVRVVGPTPAHQQVFARMLRAANATGNVVSDAHLQTGTLIRQVLPRLAAMLCLDESPTTCVARSPSFTSLETQSPRLEPARHRRFVGGQCSEREQMASAGAPARRGQRITSPESPPRCDSTFAARPVAAPACLAAAWGPSARLSTEPWWTRQRVAALIEREFAIVDSPRHVGRLLTAMNWSVQRPLRRARQRNEEKITRWRTERWPALQAKPNA